MYLISLHIYAELNTNMKISDNMELNYVLALKVLVEMVYVIVVSNIWLLLQKR